MNSPISKALPALAALGALIVWGLTLPQLAEFGGRLTGLSSFSIVFGSGLAALLTVLSSIPKLRGSTYLLWLSGGIWTGAGYISSEAISLAYFVVAILTLGSAAMRERERGKFTVSGPAIFLAATIIMVLVSDIPSG